MKMEYKQQCRSCHAEDVSVSSCNRYDSEDSVSEYLIQDSELARDESSAKAVKEMLQNSSYEQLMVAKLWYVKRSSDYENKILQASNTQTDECMSIKKAMLYGMLNRFSKAAEIADDLIKENYPDRYLNDADIVKLWATEDNAYNAAVDNGKLEYNK